MSAGFALHPRLEADSLPLGRLTLCYLRLMNDSRFPWLVLIPARPDLREIHALDADSRAQLMDEIAAASAALQRATGAEKMNIGALGNMVPQLHIHVLGRFSRDAAWPGPVWGHGTSVPYPAAEASLLTSKLLRVLDEAGIALEAT